MKNHDDFLVEIHTEELPPKALLKLAEAFNQQIKERLQKAGLDFADIKYFATPRRLAVLVKNLVATQPDQVVERKGPALSAAFDAQGNPSPACVGFARSCGVTPDQLTKSVSAQGEWVSYTKQIPGKSIAELLPEIVEQSVHALPIPKRMRWGDGDAQFVRPIHSIIMLYGDEIVEGKILGYAAGRVIRGHRFHAPDWITISSAKEYESILLDQGLVMADFASRRHEVEKLAQESIAKDKAATVLMDSALLDEVTGLVELPVALVGSFAQDFLSLPSEVLISSMQDHQRYFPVVDAQNKLLPYFVTISNIRSRDPKRVIHGNERVLRARLSDAAFFYKTDKQESLESRIERLKGIVFQAKLGTLYDKTQRISQLTQLIAEKMHVNQNDAARAGWLAKTDLTTNMVGEFPELQGVMGYYYAQNDGESTQVAIAMKEQYMPRFAGDDLPDTSIGQALALADRLDTLVGAFGINQIPTGDKDPYGLRRAALGVIRILVEKKIDLDLKEMLIAAEKNYQDKVKFANHETVSNVLSFIQERMRAWYQDQGMTTDVFASVAILDITNPLDIHKRIHAVQAFKKLAASEALSIANKRVSNILAKYLDHIDAEVINPNIFETAVEQELAHQLELKSKLAAQLSGTGNYDEVLLQLAELRQPVDDFFDQVMVMTEDKSVRENRILLLRQLRSLFLQVADIALLQ